MNRSYLIVVIISFGFSFYSSCQIHENNILEGQKGGIPLIDSLRESWSFENPALMAGTDLLSLFRRYYYNQEYNLMLAFTSRNSIKRYGKNEILKFYKSPCLFGPELKLRSIKYDSAHVECTMNYEQIYFGTLKVMPVKCSIENDSAKLVICDLTSIYCQ